MITLKKLYLLDSVTQQITQAPGFKLHLPGLHRGVTSPGPEFAAGSVNSGSESESATPKIQGFSEFTEQTPKDFMVAS